MSTARIPAKALCLWVLLAPGLAFADSSNGSFSPQLGKVPSPEWLAAQPGQVFADGRGLPPGSGNAGDGAVLYKSRCAGCHGSQGQGSSALELVGDRTLLATEFPDRGVAVYWPYAPPLFDYIRRAMPPEQPYSLGVEETYAVVAYILVLNELADAGQEVDAAFLSGLVMPNREGFRSLQPHKP